MNYLSKFSKFKEEVKIHIACRKLRIKNYTIRDGLVDVNGDVYIPGNDYIEKLPIKFGIVTGFFSCCYGVLKTLEGSPSEVGGYFSCTQNNLTSLKGAPKKVGGDFNCRDNKITSFEGDPEFVGGDLICAYNKIKTLEHFPKVNGVISMIRNELPMEIRKLNSKGLKKVIYEQDFYEIWRDGKLFEPRWKELKIDMGICK